MPTKPGTRKVLWRADINIWAQLEQIALSYGLSANAMVSYIVGSYVHTHRRTEAAIPDRFKALIDAVVKKENGNV